MRHLSKLLLSIILCLLGISLFASESSKKSIDESLQPIEIEYLAPDYIWKESPDGRHPTIPQLIKSKKPKYPNGFKRKKIQGYVEVCFVIEKDGTTSHIVATKATNKYFASSAVEAVKKWKFTSAIWENEKVAIQSRAPLYFQIK